MEEIYPDGGFVEADSAPATDAYLEFRGVAKTYDGRKFAVADLDLTARRGEFLTLLGPSGSGKTTTLMMLAGFETPTRGAIRLASRDLSRLPPHRRNMGIVFQGFALFAHMTVAENVAFPLRVRSLARDEIERRVTAALAMVRVDGLEQRRPTQLSGGEQQRVALARALVFDPDLILMDEPLGALDKQLREQLQLEIKRIHRELGVTVIYVTHDQSEALTLSDRIAVFESGRLRQTAPPRELYERPADVFVARFIGDNNLLPGRVAEVRDGRCVVRTEQGLVLLGTAAALCAAGDAVVVCVRPENLVLSPPRGTHENTFDAVFENLIYHGDHCRLRVRLAGGIEIFVRSQLLADSAVPSRNQPLQIGCDAEVCRVLPLTEAH